MPFNCTSMLSLLVLLLMIHWSYTLSLHSLLYSIDDYQNSDSHLSSIERRRRWNKNEDHDEVEIPLNETLGLVNNIDDITTLNSIVNSTLLNFETIESNSSNYENVNDLINSTVEVYSNENTTMRQTLIELNPTNVSMMEDIKTDTNKVSSFNESIDFNQTVQNGNELQSSSSSSSIPLTVDQVELTTIIENNQTNDSKLFFNDSFIPTNDEWIIHSNITQKDAIIINPEIYTNETDIIYSNSNETSIITSKSISIPICDHSCQCLKECPYGFEIFNDTCLCNPPCKNYQCFGNDTCIVTDKGQPLCQPANGIEHDRPIRCYQPRDAGYHDNSIRYYNRWYYHPDQDTCHLFVYRGMGGNENNFQTLNECHLECITCAPLPDPGECLGHINMWYFDTKENQCKEFQYSGCKGNENKFLKKELCIDTCVNRIFNL